MLSVIIPVKNGASTLAKCLESLKRQSGIAAMEIIILYSMSSDGSKEIASLFNTIILDVPEGTFNHGLTRNLGVQHAKGDLIFFTVQDAWLVENDMLQKMAAHFANEEVMGVVGHQAVPHERDKNPLLWFRRVSEPTINIRKLAEGHSFDSLHQDQQQALINWDNVVAMYRRNTLIKQPFEATQFAEDWIWSKNALLRGWILLRDPSLVVYHYHHQGYRFAYNVAYAVNYHFYTFFHFKPGVPNIVMQMLKAGYHLTKHKDLKLSEKLYWVFYNWKVQWGTFNSHVNFLLFCFVGGAKSVKWRYDKVCKAVPQGKQKV